jgi:hypothetical protein
MRDLSWFYFENEAGIGANNLLWLQDEFDRVLALPESIGRGDPFGGRAVSSDRIERFM